MVKKTDKIQNKRITALEKKLRQQQRPKPKPKGAAGKPKKGKKNRVRNVLSTALSKMGPVLSSLAPPPASIAVAGHGRGVVFTAGLESVLFVGTAAPFERGSGSSDNPFRAAGGLIIRINDSTGAIVSVTKILDMTQAVNHAMLTFLVDSYKCNSARFSLKYNGSHAFRMGQVSTIVAPHKDSCHTIEAAIDIYLTNQNSGSYQAMREEINSRKYVRVYNFNDTQHVEEVVPCGHTWLPYVEETMNFANSGADDDTSEIAFSHGGVHYRVPYDAYFMFVAPLPAGSSSYPSFTFSYHANWEFHVSQHPGLMTPTLPPSAAVTNANHALRSAIHKAAMHHDVPQQSAIRQAGKGFDRIVQFAKNPTVRKIGTAAITAALAML